MAKCDYDRCTNEAKYHWRLTRDDVDYSVSRYYADLCPKHQYQATQDTYVLLDAMSRRAGNNFPC